MNSDFKELISLLSRFGVKFLVVGGYAVMLYAEPRYTKDLDVFLSRDESSIEGLRAALEEFGFPLSLEAAGELALANRMISLGRPPSRIDILNEIPGVDFQQAWERRRIVSLEGVEVPFIGLEDLIRSKRESGRPQDMLDVSALEKRMDPS